MYRKVLVFVAFFMLVNKVYGSFIEDVLDGSLKPFVQNSTLGFIGYGCDYNGVKYTVADGVPLDEGYHHFWAVGIFQNTDLNGENILGRGPSSWKQRNSGEIVYLSKNGDGFREITAFPGTTRVIPYVLHEYFEPMYIPVNATHVRFVYNTGIPGDVTVDQVVTITEIFPMIQSTPLGSEVVLEYCGR